MSKALKTYRFPMSARLERAVAGRFFSLGGLAIKREGPSVYFSSAKTYPLEYVGAYVAGWQDAWYEATKAPEPPDPD